MRLHRLVAIMLLMESRGRLTAKELADALETSIRSIYRDIDTLAESGIPIVSTRGPNGGIALMEGYTVNLKQLNGEDVIHLYLTGMGIYSGHAESGLKLKNALMKLEKTLPPAYQADVAKAKARFYFDNTPWWTEPAAVPCLEIIRTAVWRSQKLQIRYSKPDGSVSSRCIHPYGLVVKKADWYLVAYCELAREQRIFKCERIVAANHLAESFAIPDGFVLEQQWKRQEASFKQDSRDKEQYTAVIRVGQMSRETENNLEILEEVSAETGLERVLTVNLYSYEAACREIDTHLLGQAEIVAPPELRRYANERLNSMLARYQESGTAGSRI